MSDFDVALRGFAALDEEALARPWSWRDKAMDVQTRYALDRKDSEPVRIPDDRQPTVSAKDDEGEVGTLHRFAAHLVEHTIQLEKSLALLDWPATEGRRIARHVAAAIAEIEGLGAVADARGLEARLAERYASIGA